MAKRAVAIDGEGCAVEDELVLAAELVGDKACGRPLSTTLSGSATC
jgi:hypothetical protein